MSAKLGLAVSALLFVGWLGYLGYLVAVDARPPVVKYAQLIAASAEVVAKVDATSDGQPVAQVTIEQVLSPNAPVQEGQRVTVVNLGECVGFNGPGSYLIPLATTEGRIGSEATFRVPGTARSPGVEPKRDAATLQPLETEEQHSARMRPTIYAWVPAVQEQYKTYRPDRP